MKQIKFQSGVRIPALGLGTWQITGKTAYESVTHALKVGYRHIDTADAYDNHEDVAQAIKDSQIPRNQLFITTKVWRQDLEHSQVIDAVDRFLKELQLDYIDLVLIHWPNRDIELSDPFLAFEKLKQQQKIRTYGVSNYTKHHLKDVLDNGFHPDTNQVEFHPSFNQAELLEFCNQNDIVITAYSPLAQAEDLDLPIIQKLAEKHNVSPAEVIINWLLQKGLIAIPRSTNPDHIESNFHALSWDLSSSEVEQINNITPQKRQLDPSFGDFDY